MTSPRPEAAAHLRVEATGPLALPVDLGRPGWARAGVAPSGPFDLAAHRAANAALGNQPTDATLEILLGGLRLRVHRAVVLCLTGAPAPIRVDGLPLAHHRPFAAGAGSVVEIARPTIGLRSYLAVAGGFDLPAVLGSRCYDTLAHLGPPPLQAGQPIAVGHHHGTFATPEAPAPLRDLAAPLAVLPPPRPLPIETLRALTGSAWRISPDSDRVAVRLAGPPIPQPPGQVPSEGVILGAIQLPPSGQPLIFGPDHPLTGGYPVIGVLPRDGVDRLAQIPPGQVVAFAPEATTRSH